MHASRNSIYENTDSVLIFVKILVVAVDFNSMKYQLWKIMNKQFKMYSYLPTP